MTMTMGVAAPGAPGAPLAAPEDPEDPEDRAALAALAAPEDPEACLLAARPREVWVAWPEVARVAKVELPVRCSGWPEPRAAQVWGRSTIFPSVSS